MSRSNYRREDPLGGRYMERELPETKPKAPPKLLKTRAVRGHLFSLINSSAQLPDLLTVYEKNSERSAPPA
ncbi:hypothetical protein MMC08_005620 [Hypocenomyce scalaris]|nr:hypothetical protein [Hypocenomyce scalaris]